MNEGLFTAYQKMPQWRAILEQVQQSPSCCAITEIAEGERPFLAAALHHATGRPVLLITSGEKASLRQKQDIERLFSCNCAYFPARDLYFSRAAVSRESTWQRLKILADASKIEVLCTPVTALLDRCAPVRLFQQKSLKLSEGQHIGGPEQLVQKLIRCGYERVNLVEGQGQCARRGEIVDVFPSNSDKAIRIEFFDDEIDSVRSFDCISQRSHVRLKGVFTIAPATECLFENEAASAERFRRALDKPASNGSFTEQIQEEAFLTELDLLEEEEDLLREKAPQKSSKAILQEAKKNVEAGLSANLARHLQDADLIQAGQTIRTAPMWMNVLPESTSFVTEYFDKPILLLDCPDQFTAQIESAEKEFRDAYRDASQRGDAFEAQLGLRYNAAELQNVFACSAALCVSDVGGSYGGMAPAQVFNFGSVYSASYQSRMDTLAKDVLELRKKGNTVLLCCGGEARGKRLAEVLTELKLPCTYTDCLNGNLISREVILLPVSFSKGFLHEETGFCLISDADIYGTAYQRARKKSKSSEKIASFTDLRPGDAVVHDLHGVAIFRGIVQRQNLGITRDYLQLEYAHGDKLLVPADSFDRVGKYIGDGGNMPKLSSLGGGEWMKQKNKLRASLKELAFSLAELYANRTKNPGYAFSKETPWQQEFNDKFPYELTEDQEKSVAEIELDMESPHNMDRLLCGDVGYGKTEVALRACFKCVVEGKQAAILAPTTILVQQHYNTMLKRFEGFPVKIEMLSRFRTQKQINDICNRLANGDIDLIVGTHKLLSKKIQFKDLGLLVVDEEQRFGVSHKETIQHLKNCVDVLTLSATPIPRTLHMSMVGIRDMSLLESPPEERLPVKTYVTEYSDVIIRDAIRREMARGGQVYFLYNRVRSMEQMHDRIKNLVPDARIGIAHGQMAEKNLEDVMLDFYAGAYDVLLCTTIVESGLDVPDANTLIVFDADHYGLAQLYQIRGRVGRSSRQAYAYFTLRPGKELSETAEKRLSAIREFTEFGAGYRIAMRDLEIRGAGDVLGPQQSGHMVEVGYDTYLKLIEEAVSEAQGKSVLPELETRVEMEINAFLPNDYVEGENLRIEIYKRIGMIHDEESLLSAEEELIDRFGEIPKPVENLMCIARLRGLTRKLGMSSISLKPEGLLMRFDLSYMPDLMQLMKAVTDSEEKLRFGSGKIPTLLLLLKNQNAEKALHEGIRVLDKLQKLLAQKSEDSTEKQA